MKKQFFTCDKCGKEELVNANDYANLARWHHFDSGVAAYGSDLDGCNLVFDLCDECLSKMIEGFLHKGEILHREVEYGYSNEECNYTEMVNYYEK